MVGWGMVRVGPRITGGTLGAVMWDVGDEAAQGAVRFAWLGGTCTE